MYILLVETKLSMKFPTIFDLRQIINRQLNVGLFSHIKLSCLTPNAYKNLISSYFEIEEFKFFCLLAKLDYKALLFIWHLV